MSILSPRWQNTAMIMIYGIPNCDSVKRARAWLAAHGLEHRFHDFKKQGVPAGQLADWSRTIGWEKLLNRQGSTWRKLDAGAQAGAADASGAQALMLANPSLITRPVVEWGAKPSRTTVAFDAARWADFASQKG
jgi:arsenate reductase